ncbi:unnamed protein product [Colias eurytheme]|nr:unnamed protein product [Colias eurytheme]
MLGSIDGNEAVYDDDVMTPKSHSKTKLIINISDCENIAPTENLQNSAMEENIIIHENITNAEEAESAHIFDSSTPHSSLRKPMAEPLKRLVKKKAKGGSENEIKKALRLKKLAVLEGLHDLELERIRQTISQQKELHEQLMRHNKEKHELEILKLQLEINALKENKQ